MNRVREAQLSDFNRDALPLLRFSFARATPHGLEV